MAAANFTPISLYYSTTAAAVPTSGNLVNGELGLNITDGKLYYKDNAGVVRLLANTATTTNVSTLSFGTTGLTPNTATTGAITVAGTLITSNGGTGLSTYTAGDLLYYAAGTLLSKLAIGTAGQVLTSSGTAPQYVAQSTLSVGSATTATTATTATNVAGGTIGAILYQSGAGASAFLSGNTGTTPQFVTSTGTGVAAQAPTLTSSTGTGNVVLATSPTITTGTFTGYTETSPASVTVGAGTTAISDAIIDSGTVLRYTLTASQATTFTMPTATAGKSFVMLLKQAATTGNGTATFTGLKWGTAGAPTITATAGKMDILTFVADGANWYGSIAQGYTP